MMMVFGLLLEAKLKGQFAVLPTDVIIADWVWCVCSFFATLASLAILKFAQCKLAPSLDVDWGNYNVKGFNNLWGPLYGVPGKGMRLFLGVCEVLGGLPTLICVWVDDPRAYFLSVGAMIGLGTIMAGALMTLAFVGKTPCSNPTVAAGQMGPAVFCTTVFWGVAAKRFALVPGAAQALQYNFHGYNFQQIVLAFAAICAFGLFILAPLMHCVVGQKKIDPEIVAMDDHFFLNGNKWDGKYPTGFRDGDEELLEVGDYEDEDE
jgi:hypothetical protein